MKYFLKDSIKLLLFNLTIIFVCIWLLDSKEVDLLFLIINFFNFFQSELIINGESIYVFEYVIERFINTFWLIISSIILTLSLGVTFGILSSLFKSRFFELIHKIISSIFIGLGGFWFAYICVNLASQSNSDTMLKNLVFYNSNSLGNVISYFLPSFIISLPAIVIISSRINLNLKFFFRQILDGNYFNLQNIKKYNHFFKDSKLINKTLNVSVSSAIYNLPHVFCFLFTSSIFIEIAFRKKGISDVIVFLLNSEIQVHVFIFITLILLIYYNVFLIFIQTISMMMTKNYLFINNFLPSNYLDRRYKSSKENKEAKSKTKSRPIVSNSVFRIILKNLYKNSNIFLFYFIVVLVLISTLSVSYISFNELKINSSLTLHEKNDLSQSHRKIKLVSGNTNENLNTNLNREDNRAKSYLLRTDYEGNQLIKYIVQSINDYSFFIFILLVFTIIFCLFFLSIISKFKVINNILLFYTNNIEKSSLFLILLPVFSLFDNKYIKFTIISTIFSLLISAYIIRLYKSSKKSSAYQKIEMLGIKKLFYIYYVFVPESLSLILHYILKNIYRITLLYLYLSYFNLLNKDFNVFSLSKILSKYHIYTTEIWSFILIPATFIFMIIFIISLLENYFLSDKNLKNYV